MAEINQNYLYTDSNLWVKIENNIARIGIDDYSQSEFGEIVYIDLPKIDKKYLINDEICVIESVKTVSDIYTPLSGIITKVNNKLLDNPKLINESCYYNGWMFEIKISNLEEVKILIDPKCYKNFIN